MIFRLSSLQMLSGRFARFHDACKLWSPSITPAESFLALVPPGFTKHSCFHRHFQLCPRAFCFNGFCQLNIIRINKVDASQLSYIVELRFFDCPCMIFFSLSCLLTSLTIFLDTHDLASILFASLSAATRTLYTRREVFYSILWTVWILSRLLIGLGHHQRSNNR